MIRFEMYKTLKRKLVWVMLLGIFLYALYWFAEVRLYCFDGRESQTLQYQLEQYESAKGVLTDERLETFIENYQPAEYDYIEYYMDEDGKAKKIDELFPNIDFDLHFGFFDQWGWRLSILTGFMKYIFAFVIVAFSMTFTYEKDCGMQEILLTVKNGRKKYIKAKVSAAFFITNLLYLLVLILVLLPLFIVTKGIGWDTSIQMIVWQTTSTLDMNNLELLFHSIFMSFVAINVILLITLSASFLSENPVVAMGVTLGILLFLRSDVMAVHFNNDIVNLITSLTPINVIEVMNLTQQIPIQFGGIKIHCLTIAEVTYTLVLVVGGVIFLWVIMKRQKYYAA